MPSNKLGTGDFGEDVARVHEALVRHAIEISPEERKRQFFGPTTREAVRKFQAENGMDPTCEVCQSTAAKLFSTATPSSPVHSREEPAGAPQDAFPSGSARAQSPDDKPAQRPVRSGHNSVGNTDELGASEFAVKGRLTLSGDMPAPGLIVRACDRDLRTFQQLGEETVSDLDGRYAIPYSKKHFSRAEKGSADLVIRVFSPNSASDSDRPLVESPTLFNAPSVAEIDLHVPGTGVKRSEFERHVDVITPLLVGQAEGGGELSIAELSERDIEFLAEDTGIDPKHIEWLAQAARLSLQSPPDLSPHFNVLVRMQLPQAGGIPLEVIYGWLRAGLPAEWNALSRVRISRLRSVLLDAIDKNILPGWILESSEGILLRTPNTAIAELAGLLQAASLPQARIQATFTQIDAIESVSDELLARLVGEQILAAQEAERVGLIVSLHRLAAGEASIVTSMLGTEFASVSTGKLRHPRDLASLEPAEWERALERSGAPQPAGLSRFAHARSLAMGAANAYPDVAFRQRAARIPVKLDEQLEVARVLLNSNKDALAVEFEALDLADIEASKRDTLRAAHTCLKDLANVHPGLGLHEVFASEENSAVAAKVVGERIGWLQTVFDLNPELPFLDLDYLPGSVDLLTVNFGQLSAEAKGHVLADLKSHQRIHAVTDNAIPAQELMKAGYHSASAIAITRAADFAEVSGLQTFEAATYHARALARANDAAMCWFDLYGAARDQATTPVRAIPSRQEFFKPLQGFTALINDQPWCECAKCQSVLSPAAYFVDLMYYIEENILKDSFEGHGSHVLHLQKRRPDLWDLDLSCKNTDEFVPYLDVVNGVLERYLMQVIPLDSTSALYQHLAEQERSFRQPFHQPLERLEVLLGHFGVTRHEIARTMGAAEDIRARARLSLSRKEYDLITQARADALPWQIFKLVVPAGPTLSDALLALVEMSTLLCATELAREDLEAALKTAFVGSDGSNNAAISIAMGKRSPNDVQNNTELVRNLSLKRLDRLHRFVRLWRKLPWTVQELDYVLARFAGLNQVACIEPHAAAQKGTLERIVDLLDLGEQWSLPVDELMALTDAFPNKGLRDLVPLFDRLFNDPAVMERDGRWPPAAASRFTHPGWDQRQVQGTPATPAGVSSPLNNTHMRLLSGLQLSDQDFVVLVAGLRATPAIDWRPASALEPESISLSAASMGTLYRHARILRLLACSAADFIKVLRLAPRKASLPNDAARYISDLDDVVTVIRFAAWQKRSGFSLDEIAYVTGGARPPETADPAILATELIGRAKAERSLVFADTLFTQLGLTESQSRATVLANVSQGAGIEPFEPAPDGGYRLKPRIMSPVVSQVPIDAARRQALLWKYDPLHLFEVSIGGILGVSAEQAKVLRELADALAPADLEAVCRAIQGSGVAAHVARLEKLIAETLRLHTLFKSPVFDLAGLHFVKDNAVTFSLSGQPGSTAVSTEVVRNVAAYAALATPSDTGFTTASGAADVAAIQKVIVAVGAASAQEIARVLRSDASRIGVLMAHLKTLPANPFDVLDIMVRCLALSEVLGVGGETLALSIAEEPTSAGTFDALSRAAEDVVGAFRAKYATEKIVQEKLEPHEDSLRGRRRDGLVDYIVARWPELFADPGKLYEYFLVDVMLQGCARTSPVVAATASLQLYVHRVLMNLEHSCDWDGAVPAKKGVVAYFTSADKRQEWPWRQHFRVWEANRKVFLYPENYIEPELRDDKSPLFKELEDTLLLQAIDQASVYDAYSRYLVGFDELAHLKIAGAYYEEAARTLHLFGVTQDDAPVYYYRAIDASSELKSFSAWQKLNLQIPVRNVSPILCEGRLQVFWLETSTRPVNGFVDGSSKFTGYRHTVRLKYSTLRLDGAWSPPKVVGFVESDGLGQCRIVEDPVDNGRRDTFVKEVNALEKLKLLQKNEERDAKPIATKAQEDAGLARADRIAKQNGYDNLQDLALRGVPFTFEAAAIALLFLRGAIANEGKCNEAARSASDRLAAATESVRLTQEKIDVLNNKLTRCKTFVRWDRSHQDHKEALDSYKPEGWQWDRVYPDVHAAPDKPKAIRLMLVPRNVPQPSPGVLTLTSGDFEENPALLREMPSKAPSEIVSGTRLNWSEGKLQRVPAYQIDLANYFSGLDFGPTHAVYPGQRFYDASFWLNQPLLAGSIVASAPATSDVQVVNGETDAVIIESQGDSVWMRKEGTSHAGTRIGTGLTASLIDEFCRDGVSGLLAAEFQEKGLKELRSKISPVAGQGDPARENPFHPQNPCRDYFRETFFHIPFLVANHLNSQQDFAQTRRWYHYIFDPTAAQGDPWRYREFRAPDAVTQSLREMLADSTALDAYRNDPFSPHAIARTRMSAYQKSVIMKYIDNLLDWGDSLFNQFTMESINEATMLYVMAQDILGPRPQMLGSCGEGKVATKTYRTIRPGLTQVSDFLIELEAPSKKRAFGVAKNEKLFIVPALASTQSAAMGADVPAGSPEMDSPAALQGSDRRSQTPLAVSEIRNPGGAYWTSVGGTAPGDVRADQLGAGGREMVFDTGRSLPPLDGGNVDFMNPDDNPAGSTFGVRGGQKIEPFDHLDWKPGIDPLDLKHDLHDTQGRVPVIPGKKPPRPKVDPVALVPPKDAVFCIPPNKDLLAYWGRVEDRLFKIRNCMDILGGRRRVELFAPEIDPRLLVRMKHAGLTLDDVLNSTSGNLPPYRFSYLIEKAKQYAGTVQSFGAQLSSALEKRDGEELSHLRTVHEQNLLKLRTKMMQLEIKAAEDTIEGLRRQRTGIEYRQAHFRSLFENGQNASERKQQQLQREASGLRAQAGSAQAVASLLTIIPDVGAATAMKFGGSQLGAAGRAVAEGLNAMAAFNEVAASMAGVEASNQRRDQEWKHQVETATREIAQVDKSITAAEIRRDIALQSAEVHDRTIAQTEELFEFLREKFSSVDRYRLLSNELRRLHRMGFNAALGIARMAEQAFRAERTDGAAALGGTYWEADHAGLLAGERLLLDLQRLEQEFIERNYRQLEIEQSFSLAQFAPQELATLQRTGECRFTVPEWFFDLYYPGQYRRRLKAVRLTIPCVTGPYANVGATLQLKASSIRLDPLDLPKPVPLRHTVSMATSKGQYDAGVFDFSFRDERYMPFEGAGAIGKWQVSLPKTLRVFDYETISDVVLHLSYTADFNDELKARWDGAAQDLLDLLRSEALEPPMTRVFSLRNEFPDAYCRLVSSPVDKAVSLSIEPRHFPLFLKGKVLRASTALLRIISPLSLLDAQTGLQGASLGIGQKAMHPEQQLFKQAEAPRVPTAKEPGDQIGEFTCGDVLSRPETAPGVTSTLFGDYLVKITKAGPLASDLDNHAIDSRKLRDIVLEVSYRLASEAK